MGRIEMDIENGMVRERPRCFDCGEEVDRCLCVECEECGHRGHERDFIYHNDEYYCDECYYEAIEEEEDGFDI